MVKFDKKLLVISLFTFTLLTGAIFAGTTSTTSAPTPTGHTLEDIYTLIQDNSTTTSAHTLSPDSNITHTVSDIYVALANLIDPANLASSSVTYLGVSGGEAKPDPVVSIFSSSTKDVTSFTLADISDLIQNNNRITAPSHSSLAPSSGPNPTMTSLDDIYDSLATLINENEIATGTVYLGTRGAYEPPPLCDETCQSLREGLVAYYPLDENADDYSGNGNNGTNNGAAAVPGKVGGAYSFSGSNYIRVEDNPSLALTTEGTVSAWVNIHERNVNPGFIHKGELADFSDEAYSLQSNWVTEKARFVIYNDIGSSTDSSSREDLDLDTWYHVAATWNGSETAIYINGNLSKTATSSILVRVTPGDLFIGSQIQTNYHLHGLMDEVLIYERALSAEEISSLYNDGLGRSLIDE